MHALPAAQAASSAHAVRHAPAAHWKAPHAAGEGAWQVPAPSHVETATAWPSTQAAAAQTTEAPGSAHAARLLPSQRPWQAPVPAQAPRPA